MVRKTAWILILSLLFQSLSSLGAVITPPRPLVLVWAGNHAPACQKLVGRFLEELRSLASGRKIALDIPGNERRPVPPGLNAPESSARAESSSPERRLPLSCEPDLTALRVGEPGVALRMSYLAKADGFDASDWVPFQERYLRAESDEIALATPAPSDSDPALEPTPHQTAVSPNPSEAAAPAPRPFYGRWWFWAALAAAGAGAFAATQLLQSDPRAISVEIH